MSERVHEDDIRDYDFFKKLTELHYIEAIYLMGSRSLGVATEHADFDLVITCPEATDEQWRHIQQIIHKRDLLAEVDVTRFDALPPGDFKQGVNKAKSLLYMAPHRYYLYSFRHTLKNHTQTVKRFGALVDKHPADADEESQRKMLSVFHETLHHLKSTLKLGLSVAGVHAVFPMDIFRKAHQQGWLPERKSWEAMMHHWQCSRQRCAGPLLEEICSSLPIYTNLMQQTINQLHIYDDELLAEENNEQQEQRA